MIKTVLKEVIIILLLCIAILFVLSILFYEYNPITKVVPNKIAYTVPENIKEELEEKSIEDTISVENKVYKIDGTDLNIYKKSNSYHPSKQNPFAITSNQEANNTTTQTSANTVQKNVAVDSQEIRNLNNTSTGLK